MPSTVVHVALAWLVAAGLLGSAFDRRALLVVFAVAAFPDLDTVVGLVFAGTHRAAFHTLLIPLGGAGLVYWDTRVRESSWLRGRYDDWGVRVAWVSVVAYAFAAVGLDLFHPLGANVLYPLHDQFYSITGDLTYSTAEGWKQSFVEFQTADAGGGADVGQRGSTGEVHVPSGVDTDRGPDPEEVERHFPIAFGGWQVFVVLTSAVVLAARARMPDRVGRNSLRD